MTDTRPACNSPEPSTCAFHEHERPKGCLNTDEVIAARMADLKTTGAEHHHIDFAAERIQVTLGERKRINTRIDAAYAAGKESGRKLIAKYVGRVMPPFPEDENNE